MKNEVPHEINTQVNTQFEEELVHLADISCITMRVQKSSSGHGIPDIDGGDLSATTSGQA